VHAAVCAGSAGARAPPHSPGSPESAGPAVGAAARRGGARQAPWPDAPQRPSDAPAAGSPLRPSLQQPAQAHPLAAAMQERPGAGERTGAAMRPELAAGQAAAHAHSDVPGAGAGSARGTRPAPAMGEVLRSRAT